MGMFDSLYGNDRVEWQTKALARTLANYEIGDQIPGPPIDYQMVVIGRPTRSEAAWSYATVRGGALSAVPDDWDETLPLLGYSGTWEGGAADEHR